MNFTLPHYPRPTQFSGACDDWMYSAATPEDVTYWGPIVTHTHTWFLRHPYRPENTKK